MPKPVNLKDFAKAILEADSEIKCDTRRGKGSHCVFSKKYGDETRAFTIPTSSGEVLGPYQSKIISLFELPKDLFDKNTKKKKSDKAKKSGGSTSEQA